MTASEAWREKVNFGNLLQWIILRSIDYLDVLSAKYPIKMPERVKTTTKVGPARTWYSMPWPVSSNSQP